MRRDKFGRPGVVAELVGMTHGPEVREAIIAGLSEGRSLRQICRKDGMPDWRTVLRWQVDDEDFAIKCARAREAGAESDLAEMDAIERKVLKGLIAPQAANVVLANKRWRMEKLKSRTFGQKLEVEHSGAIRTLTDEQLESRLAQLLAETGSPGAAGGAGEAEAP